MASPFHARRDALIAKGLKPSAGWVVGAASCRLFRRALTEKGLKLIAPSRPLRLSCRFLFRRALTEKGLKRWGRGLSRWDKVCGSLPTRPNGEGIETTTPSSSPTGASQTLSTRPNQESLQRLCKPRKTPNTRKIGLPMRANGEEIQTEDSHPHSGDPCLLSTGNQH